MENAMFRLFGYALRNDTEKQALDLDRNAWEKIYKLSKKHDLAHLVGRAVKISGTRTDEDLQKAFDEQVSIAIFRYAKITYDLEAISKAFEKAEIRFIPLKGSVIRKYYREPWLRTSCDIDILVAASDVDRAKSVLVQELKYEYISAWNYELSFHTPSGNHIELHHRLNDGDGSIDKVLSTVWERSSPISDSSFHYVMNDEMYYFYHIAHMARHFANGGCGIRPFIDIWVLNHNCEFDEQKRYALLRKAGLLRFARAAEHLSGVWIDGEPHTEISAQLERFILSGGTYGTVENRVDVQQAITGSKLSYLCSRIFLPYGQLKIKYPNLEKRRWLLPFYQVKRWFKLFGKGKLKRSIGEAKITSSVTSEESARTTRLLKDLGLK